ncbi:MAG: hypothetical protein PUC29_00205 [Clostridia bacterium]|nr:hypothetical protein [Clostridia bacterium]
MKKLFFALLFSALLLISCGNGNDAEKESDTAAPDWRNLIEYEGSFYVDRDTKLLYANDTGKITLWESAGDGEILQEIKYDTLVPDAVDRMETEDINSDSYSDIRIIYRETENGVNYNLWLWSEKAGKFVECRPYREITSPETAEDGSIVGRTDNGQFGVLETVYRFDENEGLTAQSFKIFDAEKIAEEIFGGLSEHTALIAPAEGKATVNSCSCPVFTAKDPLSGETLSYIAYSDTGEWFFDEGCTGFYRSVVSKDNGGFDLGYYAGEPGNVQEAVEKLCGSLPEINSIEKGEIGSNKAVRYTLSVPGEASPSAYVITVDGGLWYYCTDGVSYCVLKASDGTLGDAVNITFVK